jgi:hypothetical protein
MKKSNLTLGFIYLLVGAACLIAARLTETRLESLLWGFAGAGLCSGTVVIYRYFYWNAPSNRAEYAERLENERIELQDELKRIFGTARRALRLSAGALRVERVHHGLCRVGHAGAGAGAIASDVLRGRLYDYAAGGRLGVFSEAFGKIPMKK